MKEISSFTSTRTHHSKKFAEKKRKKMIVLICAATLFGGVAITAFAFLVRAPFLQVHTVVVEGSTFVPKEKIEAATLASLSGNYFHIVPFGSTLFLSKSRIRDSITHSFKELQDFSIHRTGLSQITLSLEERVPAAIVCAGFRDDSVDDTCFWSDKHGYVFNSLASTTETLATTASDSSFSNFSLKDYDHYYIPTDAGDIKIGENFIEEKTFQNLEKFVKGAAKGGLFPLGVLVGDNGEYEMYIQNKKDPSEVTIYFDDHAPFDTTLSNLLTFWQNPSTGKKATTTESFDYINLRFGNTVYYSTQ